jgi:arabinan endo-1,5-alpha-L-arabinosidase
MATARCLLFWCAFSGAACLEKPDLVAATKDGAGGDAGAASTSELLPLSGDLVVHDPSVAEGDGEFWLFSTGEKLPRRVSSDLLEWQEAEGVFDALPDWVAEEVPDATGFWSPDVGFFGGAHHLYYAVSTFGSGRSCIGHATTDDLANGGDWTDRGPVICSDTGETPDDDFNAIDPSVYVEDGSAWLTLGSYRSGIKLLRLDAEGNRADDELIAIAARPDGGGIQASELTFYEGYYYLFVAFDSCCEGAESTHKLMVGRASKIEGPYRDRAQYPMLDGGGTLLLQGDARFRGPGSNDLLTSGDESYNVYRAYDADNEGEPTLRISTLRWDGAGWPITAGP